MSSNSQPDVSSHTEKTPDNLAYLELLLRMVEQKETIDDNLDSENQKLKLKLKKLVEKSIVLNAQKQYLNKILNSK